VTVSSAVDPLGHVQVMAHASSFATPDAVVPVLELSSPAAGDWTSSARPTVTVTVSDALAGPDTARAEMRLDGQPVAVVRAQGYFLHTPSADLGDGTHTVEASAHDRAGNLGGLVASFHVDTRPPERS
jgi:hypothetical protein